MSRKLKRRAMGFPSQHSQNRDTWTKKERPARNKTDLRSVHYPMIRDMPPHHTGTHGILRHTTVYTHDREQELPQ